jgi:hypothetical protein
MGIGLLLLKEPKPTSYHVHLGKSLEPVGHSSGHEPKPPSFGASKAHASLALVVDSKHGLIISFVYRSHVNGFSLRVVAKASSPITAVYNRTIGVFIDRTHLSPIEYTLEMNIYVMH